jgi:hypothetical protein
MTVSTYDAAAAGSGRIRAKNRIRNVEIRLSAMPIMSQIAGSLVQTWRSGSRQFGGPAALQKPSDARVGSDRFNRRQACRMLT